MPAIIKKIKSAAHNRTTYKVGLLQAKAYRLLKAHTARGLSDHGASTIEWAFLGLLYDMKEGVRSSVLARELGVEAPFISNLSASLQFKGMVESVMDENDSRGRIVRLTQEGIVFVEKVEQEMQAHMRPLLKDISICDLVSYISVLETLVINIQKYE